MDLWPLSFRHRVDYDVVTEEYMRFFHFLQVLLGNCLEVSIPMAPLLFSSLSQAARNVLNSGYVLDMLKFDLITNPNNAEIRISGTQNVTSNAVIANLDVRSVVRTPIYCKLWTIKVMWSQYTFLNLNLLNHIQT